MLRKTQGQMAEHVTGREQTEKRKAPAEHLNECASNASEFSVQKQQ